MRIGICIITCLRLDGLSRLIESLNNLHFIKSQEPDISIFVVDNDAAGSARVIYEMMKGQIKHPIIYDIEAKRGIPYARNKCISMATEHNDCIAFIDDDEIASPAWLDELIFVRNKFSSAIVAGPVIPHFSSPPPEWISNGSFFDFPRHATGYHPVKYPETGNVLIDCSIIIQSGVIFDERMVLRGGSDACFFTQLYHAGYEAAWSDEAIVHEWIPQSRANINWILKRSFRVGSNLSYIERKFKHSRISLIVFVRFLKALRRIVLGTALLPFSLLLSKRCCFSLLQFIAKGLGMLAGLVNISYDEYKTIHKV